MHAPTTIYKIIWPSPRKHEHWYVVSAQNIILDACCILNEPSARCVAPMFAIGTSFLGGSRVRRVAHARVPHYVQQHFRERADQA